jgi:peptidoglycan/LPS O-acetylase OafA/YrhL
MASENAYYWPELDALRFFAFLCVFSFHRMDYVPTDPVRNPWLFRIGNIGPFGVPIFFLLSAFLITELLLRERERTGKIHIKAFYMRRILRIWPLYFLVFFGLALLNHFVPGVGTQDPLAWLAFTFFAGNWYILHHGWIAGAVDPLWSISVEEQFYIVIPVIAAVAGRRAVAVVSGLLLAVAYVTVLLYALHPSSGDNGEWTNSFVQFQFFCAGTLIAILLRGRLVQLPLALRGVGFLLGLGCWFYRRTSFQSPKLGTSPDTHRLGLGMAARPHWRRNFLSLCSRNSVKVHSGMARVSGPNLLRTLPFSLLDLLPHVRESRAIRAATLSGPCTSRGSSQFFLDSRCSRVEHCYGVTVLPLL